MIDLDRLRNARDADYETGTHLCKEGAAERYYGANATSRAA